MRNLPRVHSIYKMAAEYENSASGSSASSRRLFCRKNFENVCSVKIAVKRRLHLKLVVSFVGKSSHTYHGVTGAMHEHCFKRKHPIEMEDDQPRTRIWT